MTSVTAAAVPQSSKPIEEIKPDEHELMQYYKLAYPATAVVGVLSKVQPLREREFAFVLDEKSFVRGLYFNDAKELTAALCKEPPLRFEFGACSRSNGVFARTVTGKELVFDLDANDYDTLRSCDCKGKKQMCNGCYPFLACGMEIVTAALTRDFGFDAADVIWTYSGRRGVHCMVSGERAVALEGRAREAIFNYLSPTDKSISFEFFRDIHPAFSFALSSDSKGDDMLHKYFLDHLVDHALQRFPEDADRCLDIVSTRKDEKWRPPRREREHLAWKRDEWDSLKTGRGRWTCLMEKAGVFDSRMAAFCYTVMRPRLDGNVTKDQRHLLGAPYCVHPSTGKICVFIPGDPLKFDPDKAPTVSEVLTAMNRRGKHVGFAANVAAFESIASQRMLF